MSSYCMQSCTSIAIKNYPGGWNIKKFGITMKNQNIIFPNFMIQTTDKRQNLYNCIHSQDVYMSYPAGYPGWIWWDNIIIRYRPVAYTRYCFLRFWPSFQI
jgi:hypothetical protein